MPFLYRSFRNGLCANGPPSPDTALGASFPCSSGALEFKWCSGGLESHVQDRRNFLFFCLALSGRLWCRLLQVASHVAGSQLSFICLWAPKTFEVELCRSPCASPTAVNLFEPSAPSYSLPYILYCQMQKSMHIEILPPTPR